MEEIKGFCSSGVPVQSLRITRRSDRQKKVVGDILCQLDDTLEGHAMKESVTGEGLTAVFNAAENVMILGTAPCFGAHSERSTVWVSG